MSRMLSCVALSAWLVAVPGMALAQSVAPTNTDAMAKVTAQWASYDQGNKGKLTALEFGKWIIAARGQDSPTLARASRTGKQAKPSAVKLLNATASDLIKADADRDRMISPNEMASFLTDHG